MLHFQEIQRYKKCNIPSAHLCVHSSVISALWIFCSKVQIHLTAEGAEEIHAEDTEIIEIIPLTFSPPYSVLPDEA
jgi:hypothetical protein